MGREIYKELQERELMKLRIQLEEKSETIAALKDLLFPEILWPPEWKLSPAQRTILSCLYVDRGKRKHLEYALWGAHAYRVEDPQGIITVLMCSMRKKIPEIQIETVRGYGYKVSPESKLLLQEVQALIKGGENGFGA